MVRTLLLASLAGSWRVVLFGHVDSLRADAEWDGHESSLYCGRVGFVRRWDPLQLEVPRRSRADMACWKRGDLMLDSRKNVRRRSKIEPFPLCVRGEAEETGRDGQVGASSVDKREEEERDLDLGGSDFNEKVDALEELMAQPSVSGRGWWTRLKVAAMGFLPFFPELPDQETYFEVPREPTGPRIVWDGWGTSLCWWANFVGGLPEVDREYVVDLIFDEQKGLGFNIARYNIGGGADLKFDTNMRPFADVPGFKLSADGDYDWSADERQRAVLLGAKSRGANLFEAFSNSPPRWMTNSGSVTGNWWKGLDNLSKDCYDTFADYLTDVVDRYEKEWGLHFDYLAPFNEPVEGFWNLDRGRAAQEGCNFTVTSINKLIVEVKKALVDKGLSTELSAADAWSLNSARVLRGLREESVDAVSQINVHTYIPVVQRESDAKRSEVRDIVSGMGKRLWMSEYGPLNWGGTELDVALGVARHITLDINELQPSAWCYWQVLEIPGKNFYWGLMHAEFKYELDREDPFRVQLKKQYYVMMHFSRWIRQGFTIIASEGSFMDWLVMAVDPSTNATLVLVFTNTQGYNVDIKFDVSGVAPGLIDSPVQAGLFRTSESESHKELATEDYPSPVISLRMVAKSVTTVIVAKPSG